MRTCSGSAYQLVYLSVWLPSHFHASRRHKSFGRAQLHATRSSERKSAGSNLRSQTHGSGIHSRWLQSHTCHDWILGASKLPRCRSFQVSFRSSHYHSRSLQHIDQDLELASKSRRDLSPKAQSLDHPLHSSISACKGRYRSHGLCQGSE